MTRQPLWTELLNGGLMALVAELLECSVDLEGWLSLPQDEDKGIKEDSCNNCTTTWYSCIEPAQGPISSKMNNGC